MMRKLMIICFCLLASVAMYGQCESYASKMINKIDSIAKAENIAHCYVVHYLADGASTGIYKPSLFKFDGTFLFWQGKYYNMDKLVYFYVEKNSRSWKTNHIIFVFQRM